MKMNRRAILGGAVISPAALSICKAAPYVPEPALAASAEEHLVALGRDHAAAVPVWISLRREINRLSDLRDDIAEQRGFTPFDHDAIFKIGDEIGYSAIWDAWNELSKKLEQIADEIRAIPPRSLAGLRAWASAARFAGLFDGMPSEREFDYSEQWLLDALDHVERLAEGASA